MDFNALLEKANEISAKMQSDTKDNIYVGSQGGEEGVIAKVNDTLELVELHIHDDLLQDKDMLSDMIIIAVNEAIQKANEAHTSQMESYMKNLGL